MFKIQLSVFVICVFVSSSHQQSTLQKDLAITLTPWLNAAYSIKPLAVLIYQNIEWLQLNLLGLDKNLVHGVYRSTEQKLEEWENKARSQDAKTCFKSARVILSIVTDKIKVDGICMTKRQDALYKIVREIYKGIFPKAPTPMCPIPVLCGLDIATTKLSNVRKSMMELKQLLDAGVSLVSFIVYFPRDLQACRQDINVYKELAGHIGAISLACNKL